MKAILAFMLIVTVGSMWETQRDRPRKALPLLAVCTVLAAGFFSFERLL